MPDELDLCTEVAIGLCDRRNHGYGWGCAHSCTRPDGHDQPHECGCGHTWTEPDD